MYTETTALYKEIAFLCKAIDKDNTLPILDNIMFDERGMHASNLSTNITIARKHDLKVAVNGKKLLKILNTVKHIDEIELKQSGVEGAPRLKIKAGTMVFDLCGDAYGDFPKMPHDDPDTKWEVLAKAIDSKLIVSSLQFAGTDELRPVMSGVFIGEDIVATDAHVLVRRKNPCHIAGKEAILPAVPVRAMNKCGNIDLYITPDGYNGKCELPGGITMSWRNIDGRYPNYMAVWPEQGTRQYKVDRTALYRSVCAALNVANATTHQIKFDFQDTKLFLGADDIDFGNHFNCELEVENLKGDKDRFRIGFNGRFVQKVLRLVPDEELILDLTEPNKAGIWSDTFLVMPVMLND